MTLHPAARLLTALSACALAAHSNAQGSGGASADRAGNWEASIGLIMSDDASSSGPEGSSLDIDQDLGLSLSLGYNLAENFALRFDGAWLRPDYDAVLNTEDEGLLEIDHELSVFSGHFSGVWNMLDGDFTPYAQAGIGWTYLDSNVLDGPPTTGCWWDPWWGYICSNFYSTYSDTNFSWTLGLGLRYDLSRTLFLRGGVERRYLDSDQGADPEFDALRVELGWKF